jgi:hypothetical protein
MSSAKNVSEADGAGRQSHYPSLRIFIENPPPFRYAPVGEGCKLVALPIEEGLETARQYLDPSLGIAGFHHSEVDRFEAKKYLRDESPRERHDPFEYALVVNRALKGYRGLLIPHRVVVYQRPEDHAQTFRRLAESGIRDVVLVGKPFSRPMNGIVYSSTVEGTLAYLRDKMPELQLNLGVIGIHTRGGEAERILRKFIASGRRLRVMGQFLDDANSMIAFMCDLERAFASRHLSLDGLEWNVGLAIFALNDRTFYSRLLRKDGLACEDRFRGLQSLEQRVEESVRMNLEFTDQVKAGADRVGLDLGFSIQPIIERWRDGMIHPAVFGAVDLARRLSAW